MTLPPVDYVVPRALVAASIMDLGERPTREVVDLLEQVLVFALRRDPDATRDLLAELMMAEPKSVRIWAIGPFLAALRSWDALD